MLAAIERVSTALACMALDDRLSGILFFDMSPRTLVTVAERYARDVCGSGTRPLVLGAGTADDGLWTVLKPTLWGPEISAGPLVGRAGVVVVPDLAQLSLAGSRAAVSTAGADVAHVERDGLSEAWRPTARWMAACARADVPRVSAHLLARFPLRIDASGLMEGERGL